MGKNHPSELSPTHGLPDRERFCLQRFSCGIRILTTHCGPDGKKHTTLCALKKLSTAPANKLTFTMRKGQSMTIADYFQRTQNKPLQFPDVIWAEVCSISLSRTRLIHFQGWIRRPRFAG
jgi:eukaryotic translation initiation factor 2C